MKTAQPDMNNKCHAEPATKGSDGRAGTTIVTLSQRPQGATVEANLCNKAPFFKNQSQPAFEHVFLPSRASEQLSLTTITNHAGPATAGSDSRTRTTPVTLSQRPQGATVEAQVCNKVPF